MKKVIIILILTTILGCQSTKEVVVPAGHTIEDFIYSESINLALLEENPEQSVNIYLPASYYESEKRYPVVYFLHGFGERNRYFISQKDPIDRAIYNGATEFIFVEPNGTSSLGGSFYYNSAVSGNWEDYITEDLISHIDLNYRTKANKESRGIAGFSMGGTGALNIALKHPDKFNAVYVFSPGILKNGEIDTLLRAWGNNRYYENSYGAANSPNAQLDPMWEIPNKTYKDNEEKNNQVKERWHGVFANFDKKVATYKKSYLRLDGIKINVNYGDYYKWIVDGGGDISAILFNNSIPYELEMGSGGHALPVLFYVNNIIPYFSAHLE